MADAKKRPRGGKYCCAGAPNDTSCTNCSHTPGISMQVRNFDAGSAPVTVPSKRDWRDQRRQPREVRIGLNRPISFTPLFLVMGILNTAYPSCLPVRNKLTYLVSVIIKLWFYLDGCKAFARHGLRCLKGLRIIYFRMQPSFTCTHGKIQSFRTERRLKGIQSFHCICNS